VATNFPTSLDNTDSQKVVDGTNVIVAALPNNLLDMIKALQAKVGVNASTVQSSIDFFMRKNYVKVSEVQNDAAGGGISAATWTKRPFNTKDTDDGNLCSLSSNQITLVAGTYRCRIAVPGHNVGYFYTRLYNATGSALLLTGPNTSSAMAQSVTAWSVIVGQFKIAASQALEVQMYCSSTRATDGMGETFHAGNNVYAVAEFWKLY